MIQHRVAGKAELADDPRRAVLGLHPVELNAVIDLGDLDPVEHAEEIEMPPGAAKLAVGRDLQPDLFLLLDDLLDLAVLDLLERCRADLAFFPFRPRFLQTGRCATGCRPRRRGTAVWFWSSAKAPENFER